MFLGEALSFSTQALRANPIRSLLTGLGMVIGTASVILVVTISLTSRDYILEQIEGVGSNLVYAQAEIGTQQTNAQVDADFVKLVLVEPQFSSLPQDHLFSGINAVQRRIQCLLDDPRLDAFLIRHK